MATPEETETLMLAYVYGELSTSDARAFELRMDADPALRAEVEGMKATRSLFGDDAAEGLRTGVDVPPPHIVDSIMRAEALARPQPIREAMFKRSASSSSSTLTARMARWVFGGGVLVAGAAVVFVVVNRSPAALNSAMSKSADAPSAEAPRAEPQPAEAADKLAQPSSPTASTTPTPAPSPDDATRARDAQDAPVLKGGAEDRKAKLDDVVGSDSFRGAGGAATHAAGAMLPTASPTKAPAPMMESPAAPPPPAKREPMKELQAAAPQEAAKDGAKAERDEKKSAAKTPSTKPSDFDDVASANAPAPADIGSAAAASAASEAASGPGAGVASDETIEERRNAILSKRAEKAKTQPKSMRDMEKSKRLEEANLAFATAERELSKKNWLSALDFYQSADSIDVDRALGAAPTLGEMRAYMALKRPADAARLARRITSRDARQHDVVDAWLLGAKAAADIGDTTLQRDLWTRLLDVPAHRAEARAALDKLNGGAYPSRAAKKASAAEMEDAAAAPPAATAAPRTDKK